MSRRGLLIAFIVSLAVNLFVLGGLTGAALMGFGRPPPPPGPPARLRAVGEALSAEHRAGWEAAIRGGLEAARPQLEQAGVLRRKAWASVAAEPPNPQAALAALDQSRAQETQARALMDHSVVSYAATLPQGERAKLGQALSQRFGRPHGGPWPGPGPGPHGPMMGSGGGPGPDGPGLPER
jgi:uncharacterized membrane protein